MVFQLINVALGLWIMIAPATLNYGRPASTSDFIVGPLVASFACIALWEATRPVRWLNLPLGLWLAASPWLLGHPSSAHANSVVIGIGVAILSCLGGRVRQRFGGGWSALWRQSAEPSEP